MQSVRATGETAWGREWGEGTECFKDAQVIGQEDRVGVAAGDQLDLPRQQSLRRRELARLHRLLGHFAEPELPARVCPKGPDLLIVGGENRVRAAARNHGDALVRQRPDGAGCLHIILREQRARGRLIVCGRGEWVGMCVWQVHDEESRMAGPHSHLVAGPELTRAIPAEGVQPLTIGRHACLCYVPWEPLGDRCPWRAGPTARFRGYKPGGAF
jgi:hypothetical protein